MYNPSYTSHAPWYTQLPPPKLEVFEMHPTFNPIEIL